MYMKEESYLSASLRGQKTLPLIQAPNLVVGRKKANKFTILCISPNISRLTNTLVQDKLM